MNSHDSFSLLPFNSFAVESFASKIYFLESEEDLLALPSFDNQPFYVLGHGSNTLFVEDKSPIIIKPSFKGVTINEKAEHFELIVACDENWHDLVKKTIGLGINGLENLALIPGSVGAAPVQNIGAYGVEIADFLTSVTWFDFTSKQYKQLDKKSCQFGYRDSIFKQRLKNTGLITEVTLALPKAWQPKLGYQGLDEFNAQVSAQTIMETVISMRESKLPDPKKLPNAGSFFKNPVVEKKQFDEINKTYINMPFYPQSNNSVKLAAGWLIEKTGLKGLVQNAVAVHDKQALVLVNKNQGTGKELFALAQYVQKEVEKKFSIKLVPEVRLIAESGEVKLMDNT